MHIAAHRGHAEALRALLEGGADSSILDKVWLLAHLFFLSLSVRSLIPLSQRNHTALDLAVANKIIYIIQILQGQETCRPSLCLCVSV